ncbi:MAG TPA: SMC-Scp complex subunit ScpB [Candidatus Xenobia bacterium]|jgi:segregation and condensation protein B
MTPQRLLESLLFVSPKPVSAEDLARVLERPQPMVEADLADLQGEWQGRGVRIQQVAGGWQMVSCAEAAPYIERLHRVPSRTPMTKAVLETLAIIAYRQPLTKRQIEKVRGVSPDYAVSTLLDKKLIMEVGRASSPGRPPQFGTTREFLKYFHLNSLKDLPPIEDFLESGDPH